ncbi:hypothetical protein [Streptomyces sp. 8N706]|uniref:hypothetical protein n=1 Tax=Streptomyces sp. 8N706 TaxID=3457416 RepID=UPI003FD12C08
MTTDALPVTVPEPPSPLEALVDAAIHDHGSEACRQARERLIDVAAALIRIGLRADAQEGAAGDRVVALGTALVARLSRTADGGQRTQEAGTEESGRAGTGRAETGTEGAATDVAATLRAGAEERETAETASEEAGAEEAGVKETGTGGRGAEETGAEATGTEDIRTEDAGTAQTGSGEAATEGSRAGGAGQPLPDADAGPGGDAPDTPAVRDFVDGRDSFPVTPPDPRGGAELSVSTPAVSSVGRSGGGQAAARSSVRQRDFRAELARLWTDEFRTQEHLRGDTVLDTLVHRCAAAGPAASDLHWAEVWDALHLALLRLPGGKKEKELRAALADAAGIPGREGWSIPPLPGELLTSETGGAWGSRHGTGACEGQDGSHAHATTAPDGGLDLGTRPGQGLELPDYGPYAVKKSPRFPQPAGLHPALRGRAAALGPLLSSLANDILRLAARDRSLHYTWERSAVVDPPALQRFHTADSAFHVSRYVRALLRQVDAVTKRRRQNWGWAEATEYVELDAGLGSPVHSYPAAQTSWWGWRRQALTLHTTQVLREHGFNCAARDIGLSGTMRQDKDVPLDLAGPPPGTTLWVAKHALLKGNHQLTPGVVVYARNTKAAR